VDGYSLHDHQKRDLQVSGKKGSWFIERVGHGQRGSKQEGLVRGRVLWEWEMSTGELEVEIKETEKIRVRSCIRKAGCLPFTVAILCLMGSPAKGFTAYDSSNRSKIIESYPLLEPDACTNTDKEGEVETTVYGEIVRIKQDRMFRCVVIKIIVSQHCRHFSSAGVMRYIQFGEPESLGEWECRQARKNKKVVINGRTLQAKIGATVLNAMFLSGAMDGDSNCETRIISFPTGNTRGGGQTAQGLYEVTLREEFPRLNELTGIGCTSASRRQEHGGQLGGDHGVGVRLHGLPSDNSSAVQGNDEGVREPVGRV
jgi:hypothetical protein